MKKKRGKMKEKATFSVTPLNLVKRTESGTCGMIFCNNSSRYKGAAGKSNVR